MGPIWGRQDSVGPHVGHMNLLSGALLRNDPWYHVTVTSSEKLIEMYITKIYLDFLWLPPGAPSLTWFNIQKWISNCTYHKVCDEITYPFTNFSSAAIEVWEWISNFIPPFTGYVITYPCWGSNQTISKLVKVVVIVVVVILFPTERQQYKDMNI